MSGGMGGGTMAAMDIGGSLIDMAGAFGQQKVANAFTAKMAGDARMYNTWMYRHRYAQTVASLKEAGLNPVLAATGAMTGTPQGSPAPSGTTASAVSRTDISGAYKRGVEAKQLRNAMDDRLATIKHVRRKELHNVGIAANLSKTQQWNARTAAQNTIRATHEAETARYLRDWHKADLSKKQAEAWLYRGTSGKGVMAIEHAVDPLWKILMGIGAGKALRPPLKAPPSRF